jgi:hypothetical protein
MALFNITINVVDNEEIKKKLEEISQKLDVHSDNGCVKNEILSKLNAAITDINNIVNP